MLQRALVAAAIAALAIAPTPPARADPSPCPAAGCPHGPQGSTAQPGPAAQPGPPPVNVNSPSYKDGYRSEHDYFAIPQNHVYLASEMKNGYTTATACQMEMRGGTPPTNPNDWLAGCVDALHELGFKP